MFLNMTYVASLTRTQTFPLIAVFQAAGHVVGNTAAEQHDFVVQRLAQLVSTLQ
jgi:hypothetical protein